MIYAGLPPEINSMRIYSGPGSGPMRAVAAAFGGLAAELHSSAVSIEGVVDELTGLGWRGPSSAAMENAAQTYVSWLLTTAEQAEQTAGQANAAAAAYDAAFYATVPPSAVAANRARYALLVATNILGQNTAAIAATDTEYYEYWAQDAAAMYTYAASSSAATQLVPFTEPQQNSNPEGLANQAASTASGNGNSVMNIVTNVLSQLSTGQLGTQGSLAPALAATAPLQAIPGGEILDFLSNFGLFDIVGAVGGTLGGIGIGVSAGAWQSADSATEEILWEQEQVQQIEYEILHAIDLFSPLTPSRPHGFAPGASAAMGEAASLGQLSVPSSWTAATPEIRGLAYSRPLAAPLPAAPGVAAEMGSAFSQMSLAGMGGSALAGSVGRSRGQADGTAAGRRVPQPPTDHPATTPAAAGASSGPAAGGPSTGGPSPTTGIAAEIREFAELRDAGIISDEEFNEQKHRLLSGGR